MKQKEEIRLNFVVSQRLLDMMEEMQNQTEMRTRTEVFNTAMGLMQWMMAQIKLGKEIGAYDPQTERFKEMFIPSFQPLYDSAKKAETEQEAVLVH